MGRELLERIKVVNTDVTQNTEFLNEKAIVIPSYHSFQNSIGNYKLIR